MELKIRLQKLKDLQQKKHDKFLELRSSEQVSSTINSVDEPSCADRRSIIVNQIVIGT